MPERAALDGSAGQSQKDKLVDPFSTSAKYGAELSKSTARLTIRPSEEQALLKTEFSVHAPGELVALGDGWSFLPDNLPPELSPSWELHRLDERARGALGEFIGLARTIDNDLLITNPLITREAVESNKIENTITKARDVLLQEAGESPADPEAARDVREVLQYRHTVALGAYELTRGRPLSLHLIQSLHQELLKGTRGANKNPGRFRKEPVLIGTKTDTYATARFVPAPWEQVPALMDRLVEFASGEGSYSPLISAALLHYQLESIHPFEDGNGRLGRLLIPLYLLSRGVVDRPIIYLSAYFEATRAEYIQRLKAVSTGGDWHGWVGYFLRAVEAQATDSLRRAKLVSQLYESYRAKARANARTKATLAAVDVVMEKVIVSAQDVVAYASCSLNTAKAAMENLQEGGIVSAVPRSWPARWGSQELLDRLYES